MTNVHEMTINVDNFINAVCYTYHLDKQEMFAAVAKMAQRESNRLAALDPDRNR